MPKVVRSRSPDCQAQHSTREDWYEAFFESTSIPEFTSVLRTMKFVSANPRTSVLHNIDRTVFRNMKCTIDSKALSNFAATPVPRIYIVEW